VGGSVSAVRRTNRENCNSSQVRDQQGQIRQVSVPPQGGQRRNHRRPAQGYETKESAHKGIESVKTNAPDAKVVDLTEQEPAHN